MLEGELEIFIREDGKVLLPNPDGELIELALVLNPDDTALQKRAAIVRALAARKAQQEEQARSAPVPPSSPPPSPADHPE